MRVGLLECDEVRPVFREQGFSDYPTMFRAQLNAVEPALELVTYSCLHGKFPADPGECDAYITTGSRYSVLDGFEWIDHLEALALSLMERSIPYVGICFGHQLLAQAMGGRVVRADVGWGVGVSRNTISTGHWWMGSGRQSEVNLIVSHQDQVVEIPSEIRVLGGSAFCPIYFCQVDDTALTIQGHPEFSRDYSRALMEYRRDIIAPDVVEAGLHSLELPVHERLVFTWIVNFMRGRGSQA